MRYPRDLHPGWADISPVRSKTVQAVYPTHYVRFREYRRKEEALAYVSNEIKSIRNTEKWK
jgi:hypothetical protein